MRQIRDLTLIPIDEQKIMVIACDSLGAIGTKAADVLQTAGEIVGRLTVRVPLMEVIAAGANPVAIVNTLSVEMEPTGRAIISGIQAELADAGLDELPITGSTEENMQTLQTGIGITVIGLAAVHELRLQKVVPGSTIYCLGRPKVGAEVLDGNPVADIALLRQLLTLPWVSEILPVGSKGVLYEANELAAGIKREFVLAADDGLDVLKSAGPATCVIVAAPADKKEALQQISALPVWQIGYIGAP